MGLCDPQDSAILGAYITANDAAKLLEACPSHHWRSIVALARYGGIRCPNEIILLRWQDIDWKPCCIDVTSPKTEFHAEKATRVIPLFPELQQVLTEAFEQAERSRKRKSDMSKIPGKTAPCETLQ